MGPQHLRYGGNTPCIELICGDHHLFFDAGSGLYPAGGELIGGASATSICCSLSAITTT